MSFFRNEPPQPLHRRGMIPLLRRGARRGQGGPENVSPLTGYSLIYCTLYPNSLKRVCPFSESKKIEKKSMI